MRKLILEQTKNTPEITLDPNNGYFSFKGRSFPENSKKFYSPILDWFESFDPINSKKYTVDFDLNYISSSSIISIFELLKKIAKKSSSKGNIIIEWKHESDDEAIRKIGEDFTKLISMPLTLKSIQES